MSGGSERPLKGKISRLVWNSFALQLFRRQSNGSSCFSPCELTLCHVCQLQADLGVKGQEIASYEPKRKGFIRDGPDLNS